MNPAAHKPNPTKNEKKKTKKTKQKLPKHADGSANTSMKGGGGGAGGKTDNATPLLRPATYPKKGGGDSKTCHTKSSSELIPDYSSENNADRQMQVDDLPLLPSSSLGDATQSRTMRALLACPLPPLPPPSQCERDEAGRIPGVMGFPGITWGMRV